MSVCRPTTPTSQTGSPHNYRPSKPAPTLALTHACTRTHTSVNVRAGTRADTKAFVRMQTLHVAPSHVSWCPWVGVQWRFQLDEGHEGRHASLSDAPAGQCHTHTHTYTHKDIHHTRTCTKVRSEQKDGRCNCNLAAQSLVAAHAHLLRDKTEIQGSGCCEYLSSLSCCIALAVARCAGGALIVF